MNERAFLPNTFGLILVRDRVAVHTPLMTDGAASKI